MEIHSDELGEPIVTLGEPEKDAEEIQHHVSPATLTAIRSFLRRKR